MMKRYEPPEWELIRFRISTDMMLTGSIEEGGDILDTDYDNIEIEE